MTVPVPEPAGVTVSVTLPEGTGEKVAVTVMLAVRVTVQKIPETESQPLQPAKSAPGSACAVSVTAVPLAQPVEPPPPPVIPPRPLLALPVPQPHRAPGAVKL